jgi:hypothetical protein
MLDHVAMLQQMKAIGILFVTLAASPSKPSCVEVAHQPASNVAHTAEKAASRLPADLNPGPAVDVSAVVVPIVKDVLAGRGRGVEGKVAVADAQIQADGQTALSGGLLKGQYKVPTITCPSVSKPTKPLVGRVPKPKR